MSEIPKLIKEICPSCNPQTYKKTLAKFIGEEEDGEYLYQCIDCEAKIWVDEQWAKQHEVNEIDTLKKGDKVLLDDGTNPYIGFIVSIDSDFITINIFVPDIDKTFKRSKIKEISKI